MNTTTGRTPAPRWRALGPCVIVSSLLSLAPAWAQTPPPSGYDLHLLGLTGSAYGYSSGGGTFLYSDSQNLNASGQVVGHSRRYNAAGTQIGQDAWFWNGSTTQQIGFTGSDYEYTFTGTGGGTVRTSWIMAYDWALSAAGTAAGYTERYNSLGDNLGNDAWIWTGSSTQQVGLTGSDYEWTYTGPGGGVVRTTGVTKLNASGLAVGYSTRRNASGGTIGEDAWAWTGLASQLIGLTGGDYEYTHAGGGTARTSHAAILNDAGYAAGYSRRYNPVGSQIGQDAWIWTGSATQQLGFLGTDYEYTISGTGGGIFRFSDVQFVNSSGHATGYSHRYNASATKIGEDAWLSTDLGIQQIGLTGGDYEYTYTGAGGGSVRLSVVGAFTDSGYAAGRSLRYNPSGATLGMDGWVWNGTTTQQVGLTGTDYQYTYTGTGGGTVRTSSVTYLTDAGHAAGHNTRYNTAGFQIGRDAWAWNGSSTQQIGLTGSGYEYTYTGTGGGTFRFGTLLALHNTGRAIGTTRRYNAAGTQVGQDAWLWTGSATQRAGLTGSGYEFTTAGATFRFSNPLQLNDNGQAIGISSRYAVSGASRGQAGWFHDVDTNLTTPLEFSFRSTDNFSNTTPTLLTDNGVVLGSYTLYDGATFVGNRAFWWSLEDGFHDLGQLVDATLTAEGWQYLAGITTANGLEGFTALTGGSPWYILGTGQLIDQTGGQSVFLAAAPEPGSATVILLAASAFLVRRRRARLVA